MRRRVRTGDQFQGKPNWRLRLAIFGFGLLIVYMGAVRMIQKRADFGIADVCFVVLFAAFMAAFGFYKNDEKL